ncbi:Protein of unknown function [Parapedobacter composti]|uniref:DUF3307 domain-containing protein n=1 Tax=Parapedobacter composti TaxID=623281 RepID=A0A1I1HW09_9SPHI|nr:DUF3307 domain-containing protein [Parapedobacter composti]SFC27762.1 Protein of unknown function [Parapedobacter composti]
MIVFLKLLLAHLLGDFCFQPSRWIADKQRYKIKSKSLYFHILLHAVLLALLLGLDPVYWQAVVFITISHYLIDVAKLYIQNSKNAVFCFFADQALHIIAIAAVANWYEPFGWSLSGLLSPSVLLLVTALVLVTFVPTVLISMLIAQWRPETKDKRPILYDEESLIRAGRFIGILERLLVFLFILINRWEAIGFLLAAKSIFRFGDLRQGKDRKLTEYVLIGTLLSFGIAILAGLGYVHLAAKLNGK